MKFGKLIFLLKAICIISLIFSACSPKPITRGEPDAYKCTPPQASTFASLGIDTSMAQSTIGKVVTGDIKIKTQPQVISLLSKSVVDQELRLYLSCLAINQNHYTPEQAAYLERMSLFSATNPTPDQFQRWQDSNPFPKKSALTASSQNGELVVYELVWNNVTGKDQPPENDIAIDLRNSKTIFIEVEPLLNGYHESKSLRLNVLVSSEEHGKYKRYFPHDFSPDNWPAFAVTEGPNFMKLSLDVKDSRRADLKALVTVGYTTQSLE